ncbi:O-antigen ligase family protein [Flavobacterium zhairuonense]|uniref:O-antigen ligase family protein n=1 Tax=Flavobacterium zhairuonense TaxID=2493631 RepID=UPI0013C34F2C|nr:O-antigen ligase family protein [Flavobacterium zhairuonense]KAF2510234.1 O-antigen ligase family protein [Flavobacterium zhairuonense]
MKKEIDVSEYLLKNKKDEMQAIDVLVLIIVSLYFVIDCVTISDIQDQLGIHWLLISILNFISGIFIYQYRKDMFQYSTKSIFKNSISLLYFLFLIISGVSVFLAINKVESMIIYTRFLTTAVTFLVLAILFHKRLYLFKKLSIVIAILVLIKSFSAVKIFYGGLGKVGLDVLINSLQSTEGNKNIFAAVLVVQIPILIYGVFAHKKWLKYLCAVSLAFGFMTVFLINARAAYLGLLLQLFLLSIGLLFLYYKEQKIKLFYKNGGLIVCIFLGALFLTQNGIKKAIQKDKNSVYGTIGDRLSTITDNSNSTTSVRLEYWQHAGKLVNKRPLLGVGVGNWKLYTTTYTNTLLDDNTFSKHPHNDFIEIAGESGIPNSIVYLLIFVSAFFVTLKSLFSQRAHESKLLSLVLFVSLCGYFIDAFFNFPLERPHMQILFVFLLATIIASYLSRKEEKESNTVLIAEKGLVLLIVLVSGFGIYMHYTVFKSMKAQFVIDNDLNKVDGLPDALPVYKYAEVKKMFPAFPNIAENSETIGYKEAKYLQKEKRYNEAIKVLDSVHKFSPYTAYDYYLKCKIYQDLKEQDSAYTYSKKAFYAKPRNIYYFKMAIYLANLKKDPTEIVKMYNVFSTYRKDSQAYLYYAKCLAWSGAYDIKRMKQIVNEGVKLYPKDQDLQKWQSVLSKY